jgi:cysteinyl-tRNA synthetase
MSKSLGNFFTIREILEKFDRETLRLFLLSAHYRSPLDFSDQNMKEAEAGIERIYGTLARIDEVLAGKTVSGVSVDKKSLNEAELELLEKTETLLERFREAMDDDFNTAMALGGIFELLRCANKVIVDSKGFSEAVIPVLAQAKKKLLEIGTILGSFTTNPEDYLQSIKKRKTAELGISEEEINRLIEERAQARKAKDYKRSDEIRDLLLSKNIVLLDSAQGTTWKVR